MTTQEIPLSEEFNTGSIVFHHDTYCVTLQGPGWLRDGSCVRRHYKAVCYSKQTRVSSVEAVARSLMAYDIKNPGENLIVRLIYQYYSLNYGADNGATVDLFQQMYLDKTTRVRALWKCGAREDCHNPFHRGLALPRTSHSNQYKRFLKLLSKHSLHSIMNDKRAHLRLDMNPEQLKRCIDTYFDIIADDNEL